MCTIATYRKNPEDIIIRVMPTLIEGLKAQKNPEFQIGCYMIITVLVAKLPLDETLIDSLMAGVVQGWSKTSVPPALACVALLAQEGKPGKPLPIQAVKGLSKVDNLGQMLVEMGQKYRVDELAVGTAIGILSQRSAFTLKNIKLVEKILLEVNMPLTHRKNVLMKLIESAGRADFDNEDVRTEVADFLVRVSEGQKTQQATKILHSLFESEGFDIETLEMRLQAVIKPTNISIEAPIESGPTMSPTILQDPKKTFQELIDSLPETTTETSFLSSNISPLLSILSKAVLQASLFDSEMELHQLFSLPIFSRKPADEAFTLSFLIRMWTSNTCPVQGRAAALAQANRMIKASVETNVRVDYQALLPYILIALAETSKKVRAEAANVLLSLSTSLKHVESLRKKDKSNPMRIWGFDTIFGKDTKETGEAKWMETTEARKTLGGLGIVEALEEAIVDGAVVYRTVAHGLGRDGEGLKNSLKSTAMTFIASHAVAIPDLSIKLQLLKLVNMVTSGAAAKAKPSLAIIMNWVNVEDYTTTWVERCAQEKVNIEEMEKEIVRSVGKIDKGEGVELLVNIIKGAYGLSPKEIGGMRKVACGRLREVWSSLKDDVRVIAAQKLLEVSTTDQGEEVDITGDAMDVLKNVSIPVEVFEQELQESLIALKGWTAKLGRASAGADAAQQAKRTKANDTTTAPISKSISRLTIVLELLEARTLGEKDVSLLKLGFGVLGEVMNIAGEIGVGVGYILQLILGLLSAIVNYIKVCISAQELSFWPRI